DLPGATLGLASGQTIWLDGNAAGWGWFVDRTPWEDSEFTTPGDQGEQGRMDLLTVLMHELGHVLGLDHDAGGVMAETLSPGTRLLPPPDAHKVAAPPAKGTDSGLNAWAMERAFAHQARGPSLAWDDLALGLALAADLGRKR